MAPTVRRSSTGAGAPSGGTGANGDVYIDTTARALYGPKSGGAWGAGTSLAGADGSDGADGAAIELQTSATHIQWRYRRGGSWTDLVALASLTGAAATTARRGRRRWRAGADGIPLAGVDAVATTSYTPSSAMPARCSNAPTPRAARSPSRRTARWPIPWATLHFAQDAAGQITLAPGSGVTFKYNAAFALKTSGQHAVVSAAKVATNTWRIFGDMELA